MRILAESVSGCLLLDVGDGTGRVLDGRAAVLEAPLPLATLRAYPGWLPYRGPQNLARRLRGVEVIDAEPPPDWISGTARAMTRAPEYALPRG